MNLISQVNNRKRKMFSSAEEAIFARRASETSWHRLEYRVYGDGKDGDNKYGSFVTCCSHPQLSVCFCCSFDWFWTLRVLRRRFMSPKAYQTIDRYPIFAAKYKQTQSLPWPHRRSEPEMFLVQNKNSPMECNDTARARPSSSTSTHWTWIDFTNDKCTPTCDTICYGAAIARPKRSSERTRIQAKTLANRVAVEQCAFFAAQ